MRRAPTLLDHVLAALGAFAVTLGGAWWLGAAGPASGAQAVQTEAPPARLLVVAVPSGPDRAGAPALGNLPLPRLPAETPVRVPAADPAAIRPVAFEGSPLPVLPAAPGCALRLTAEPAPAATLRLRLEAPCAAGGPVTVHHAGLALTVATDEAGRADLRLPALADPAVIVAEANGESAVLRQAVPDLARWQRAVLGWRGEGLAALHVREAGAAYGEPGHRHADAPGSEEAALAGEGGWILRLGSGEGPEARRAEVWTAPRDLSAQVTVEAQVTERSCGRVLEAQAFVVGPQGSGAADLSLSVPGCDALGEWVAIGAEAALRLAAR